jgi:hypothetical protein
MLSKHARELTESLQGEMRRHDTYCSNFSCLPVTLTAGLRPGALRVMGLPSNLHPVIRGMRTATRKSSTANL